MCPSGTAFLILPLNSLVSLDNYNTIVGSQGMSASLQCS